MWTEITLGGIIVLLIILLVLVQGLITAKSDAADQVVMTPSNCDTCPATRIVPMRIKANGSTVMTTIPAVLPALVPGVSDGQYIRDSNNGSVYLIQHGMLSYIVSYEVLVASGYKGHSGNYPTSTIVTMAFGPPILS